MVGWDLYGKVGASIEVLQKKMLSLRVKVGGNGLMELSSLFLGKRMGAPLGFNWTYCLCFSSFFFRRKSPYLVFSLLVSQTLGHSLGWCNLQKLPLCEDVTWESLSSRLVPVQERGFCISQGFCAPALGSYTYRKRNAHTAVLQTANRCLISRSPSKAPKTQLNYSVLNI